MKLKNRDTLTGIGYASPFFFGFIVFFIAPFIVSVVYTFTFGTGGTHFVGFDNYISVMSSNAFKLAAFNTMRFIAICVPLIMAISLVLALLLKGSFGGSSFFRSAFIFPLVVPIASTVMVFQIIFAETGILNTIYTKIGFPVHNWLQSDYAFGVLVFLYIWKNCGYNIVLLLAGLNAIPHDFYEAAQLEGANRWQCLRYITVPIMAPTFFFVFVVSIINSFKSFREAFLLSSNRPHKSIYMLQHFMNNNFTNFNYQRLSVAAFLVFIVIFILVLILFSLRKKAGDVQL
ncbi:sugar ABC transporter permease [Paludicola sp. MB14-C6]|uniref:carbohydrate ABC transporter permease n=1 Tax=Paludihabitans sp. MB14-C6 TaxID=3070656 RepID=UPI0027DC2ED5|nr:sugar ABC transporter permease [Paludicola sp. MB14-C6]WMJ22719.1 sugar ABC transporter permease [Paludicola sp. MB14-C6]